MRALICVAVGVFALEAVAVDLRAPYELENTKVLPKNIRNPRFKNIFTSITGRYDASGFEQPLGARLNKVVSWNEVLNAQPTQADKNTVQGMMTAAGITDPNGSPGSTTGAVNSFVQVFAPVLAWGITDRYTLAVAVPIYSVQLDQDAGFLASTEGQKFVDTAQSSNVDLGNDAKNKLNNAINEKLQRLGYMSLSDQKFQTIGDIRLVGKYVVDPTPEKMWTLKHEFTFPTGLTMNPDNALSIPIGDGQFDAGLTAIHDEYFLTDFRWNSFVGYNIQFPGQMTKRLPTSATDSLSADKETLWIDVGDVISAGTSINYELPGTGISAGVGYQFQRMAKASIQDGRFAPERYRLLENELPERSLHSLLVSLGFSTVDMYKQKKFVLPLQANLAYSQALGGFNATTNSMLSAELVMFF